MRLVDERALMDVLSAMDPISLQEMNSVKLMNRTDTKFLLNRQQLLSLAQLWQPLFFVQNVNGVRVSNYTTLYFDTPDALTYTVHHNKKLKRQKIRQRQYLDTGDVFCEIKNKVNTGRTKKKRIAIPQEAWGNLYDLPEMADFVREKLWLTDQPLSPRLQNRFQRITLVNKAKTERITIDSDISFHNVLTNMDADVSELVIVEVKQDGSQPSEFTRLLRDARIQPKGLSKYCLGMLLTDDNIKYNRFKDKIHYVSRLVGRNMSIAAVAKARAL